MLIGGGGAEWSGKNLLAYLMVLRTKKEHGDLHTKQEKVSLGKRCENSNSSRNKAFLLCLLRSYLFIIIYPFV